MSKPPVSRFPIRCVVPHHESSSPAAVCRLPSSRMITPPSSHSRAQHVIITYTNTDLFLSSSKRRKQKKSFPFFCCIVVIHFSAGAAQNIVRVGRDDVGH